jgi:glycosyltransferase involved in cell wall biosynthesis
VEIIRKEFNMKKIVIDVRESGTSTGRYMDKLVENLHSFNISYNVTLLAKSHRVDHFKKIAPKFTVIESNFKEFTFAEQLNLLGQINGLGPDLVHFTTIQQPVFYKHRKITTVHDLTTARFRNPSKNWLIFTIKQIIYKWVIKKVAHKSEAILTPSKFVKNDIAKYANIDSSRVTVTYEAGDRIPDKAIPLADLKDRQFIMYVGRPQPHKNLSRLIDAFVKLQSKHPELYLILAGKKDILYEEHERRVSRQKIKNVIFTGFVSEGQLRWLYENCAAYVFPSLSEGFGLPPLEAMMHGAPIISSNATCLPEVYGEAAHYFNPTDIDDMAAKIDDVLSSPKLRQDLVEKGKKQVKKYSWKRMAGQTLEVYKQILDEK